MYIYIISLCSIRKKVYWGGAGWNIKMKLSWSSNKHSRLPENQMYFIFLFADKNQKTNVV